jgi:NADPH:quinone reductase-like Zn-dependent oxidoreductase
MKAIVIRRYGAPDALQLEDAETPRPGPGQVLVRVHAASINSWDWDNLCGTQLVNRLLHGLRRPKYPIPGADIAGTVEAVGEDVTRFRPGDEVFGDLCGSGWGAFAEYVCAPETELALKPARASFAQAAALPQAAVLALQGIRDYGRVQAGQHVLVNGAGGGVGTFAIQLAKAAGAEVTGVDSAMKQQVMRAVGADHVIDYEREDFTTHRNRYDMVLDVVGKRSVFEIEPALSPRGAYIMVGGPMRHILQLVTMGWWLARRRGTQMRLLLHQANQDLAGIASLFETGTLRPVIDGPYSLDQTPEAMRRFGAGSILGKAVITMSGAAA